MGSFIHIRRFCNWWHCCICIFSFLIISSANAHNPVGRYTYPGGNDFGSNSRFDSFNFGREATAARASGNLIEAHSDGSFTIYDKGDTAKARPRSLPVKNTAVINPQKLASKLGKNLVGGLAASIVVGAVWDEAMSGLDWVMGEGGQIQKKTNYDDGSGSLSGLVRQDGPQVGRVYSTTCPTFVPKDSVITCTVTYDGNLHGTKTDTYTVRGDSSYRDIKVFHSNGTGVAYKYRRTETGSSALEPLSPSDIESDLVGFINTRANNDYLTQAIKDACVGSLAPNRCFQTLWDQSFLSGQKSINGPVTETTTKTTNPDGTISDVKKKEETTYHLDYDGPTIEVSATTKNTTFKDGEKVAESTSTEKSDVEHSPESKPQEEEQATPVPCDGAMCEPPDYEQQFEELDFTKEDVIDEYHQTILGAPIFQAVGNFFDISAGSSCPVWQTTVDFSVFDASMNTELVFDHHCLPEFVSFRPWAMAVMLVVAGFLAFRVGVLD